MQIGNDMRIAKKCIPLEKVTDMVVLILVLSLEIGLLNIDIVSESVLLLVFNNWGVGAAG